MGVLPFLQWKHYYPITDFYTEWLAAFLGLCALICCFRKLSELPRISLVPLAIAAVVWLQYLLGMLVYPQQVLLVSLYFLWAACIAMLGHTLKREFGLEKVVPVLAWFILAGGVLNGAAAFIQHYHVPTPFAAFITPNSSEAVYGNLAQQNHFSDYMALAVASLLYLAASGRMKGFLALPLGLFLLFMLALSGSRSAWLFLGMITLLSLFPWRRERKLLAGALLLIPAFAAMQFLAHAHVLGSTGAVTSGDRLLVIAKDSGIRLYLWREAWTMFLHAPILGVGFGQFAWHHFANGPAFNDPRITGLYTNSHDIALNFLAETGLAGGLILFGGLAFWMRRADMSFDIQSWWICSLLAILILHSLDEYPLWYAQFLGIFMLLLGLGESRAWRLPMAQGAAALLLVLGSYLMMGLMRDYSDLEGLLYPSYHSGKPPLKTAALFGALYQFRKGTLLAPYVEYPFAEMLAVDERDLGWKTGLTRRAAHFSPSGMIVYRYAAFLALGGKTNDAKIMIDRAALSDPDLLGEALELYSGFAGKQPGKFGPLVEEVGMKLKEQSIAFHHK